MNVFKVFTNSSFFRACQQASGLIGGFRNFPFRLRQYSSFQNASLALNNLNPFIPLTVPSCGMKSKGKLQLRCKNCYFERKDGDMYVFCTSYGRHKQRLRRKNNRKYNWILSYAMCSKIRPY